MSKYTTNTENIGKNIKTWSPFLARFGHPRTQKWSKIGHFPQRIVFYVFPGICRRFWPEVLTQTPKKNVVFRPRSYSKGPNHALEKVLTNETPGMCRTCWSALQKTVGRCGHAQPSFTCEPQLSLQWVPNGSDARETCTHVSTPWSVSQDTPEKVAHMWESLARVSSWVTTVIKIAHMKDSFVRASQQ